MRYEFRLRRQAAGYSLGVQGTTQAPCDGGYYTHVVILERPLATSHKEHDPWGILMPFGSPISATVAPRCSPDSVQMAAQCLSLVRLHPSTTIGASASASPGATRIERHVRDVAPRLFGGARLGGVARAQPRAGADSRTGSQASMTGDPVLAALAVVILGVAVAASTLVVMRLSGRQSVRRE